MTQGRLFRALSLLAVLCSASPLLAAVPAGNLRLTVCTVTTGEIDERLLQVGQMTATRLFARIGVELVFDRWRPVRPDQTEIALVIMARAPAGLKPMVLGVANSDPEIGPAAFVFYNRVLSFYDGINSSDTGVLMGYVIAHELGHILQSEPGHSAYGVMKARWTKTDVHAMLQHQISFTKADSKQIRIAIAGPYLLRPAAMVEQ
jgi:hypothetical protein